jgi:gamma-glutamyl-gamma-aminobutyraldehyde dehydrogenase
MLAWKIGPALAAGCSVIVKPAAETTLTALRLAELATEAGLPRGVLNIVPGGGAEVGEPIGRHMDIDMVSFTGSTVTGKRFLEYAAQSNAKEVVLEMGGKNPAIVLQDAENLDRVAQHIVQGAFWNMGENCSATSRLIVHRDVRDPLIERIKHHAQHWNVGDPLNPETRLGALVSQVHFDKVCGYLKQADSILMGGETDGACVQATMVEVPSNDHPLARDEIFGPVLSVITVNSADQAIAVANDTDYGLCASIFSANIKRALRGARALRAGTVTVNSFGEGDITTPFGGYRQSGFGGRDNGIHAHDQYTQIKTIWIDLSDDADEAVQ